MTRDKLKDKLAKDIARQMWHNDPERPFTDEAWERELKWWRESKADAEKFPLGDVSYMWFADKCYRVAEAVLLSIEANDCTIAPNQPTEQQLFRGHRILWGSASLEMIRNIYRATLRASPFKKDRQ